MSVGRVWMVACALLLFSTGTWAAGVGLVVENPWIREAPPTASSLAGYMVVHNRSGQRVTLVGAASPAFGKVMLHRTVVENKMARMVHQEAIAIESGASLVFEPNGYHLMLMQPKGRYRAGERLTLELHFGDGTVLPAEFEVRAGGGGGMDHSMHPMQH